MATHLSALGAGRLPEPLKLKNQKIGLVTAEWNHQVTDALLSGALEVLRKHGARDKNLVIKHVPGSFELTLGAQWLAARNDIAAVICLGCVIQGETPHFDYICQAVSHGITRVSLDHNKPVIFGVLTTNTLQQALDRAGGKHGNKGEEAAYTALRMLQF